MAETVPILIDTDMGVDDAAAICLALASPGLDVRAIVGVGGNVNAAQATINISRLLAAIKPPVIPVVGRGMDQTAGGLVDRRALFGDDGLGGCELASPDQSKVAEFSAVYQDAIEEAKGELVVVALGPLTNIAAMLDRSPELMRRIKHLHLTGGAVWAQGDASPASEFNFHKDTTAAAKVLSSRLPISVTPLDVTRLVCFDESHAAHLAASGYRTGEVLSRLMRFPIEQDVDPGYGKCHLADAVTVGSLLWPGLFLKTRMRLEIVTEGPQAGRSKPALGGAAEERIDLLTAINAVDFQENLLESLCHEAFVV
jgi:inosine-uridine nucleoside N-ribohydrolase